MDTTNYQPPHDKTQELMRQTGVPGVAVGIWHNEEEHCCGFGVTHLHHPLAVDEDTLFQIGSTSKTVTATVAMRLVEAGKLGGRVEVIREGGKWRGCGWVGGFIDGNGKR